jgi:hypothetical protein
MEAFGHSLGPGIITHGLHRLSCITASASEYIFVRVLSEYILLSVAYISRIYSIVASVSLSETLFARP